MAGPRSVTRACGHGEEEDGDDEIEHSFLDGLHDVTSE
jgi:hypothetical protein